MIWYESASFLQELAGLRKHKPRDVKMTENTCCYLSIQTEHFKQVKIEKTELRLFNEILNFSLECSIELKYG